MPYEATRYRDMTPEMVQAFRSVFGQRIRDAVLDFKPDAVICHHLYLACSATCDVDDLAGEYRSPIAQGSGLAKGRPCQIWGVCHSTDLRQLYNHDLEKDRITAAVRSLDGVMALHEAQKAEIAELFDLTCRPHPRRGNGLQLPGVRSSCRLARRPPVARAVRGQDMPRQGRGKPSYALWDCFPSIRKPWSCAWWAVTATRGNTIASSSWPVAAVSRWCSAAAFLKTTWCFPITKATCSRCPVFRGLPLVTVEALASGCRAVVTSPRRSAVARCKSCRCPPVSVRWSRRVSMASTCPCPRICRPSSGAFGCAARTASSGGGAAP